MMKFICEKENLIYALNIVIKGVSQRTTLPILKGIMIKCNEGENKISLFSSDLDISIKTSAPAMVEEGGEIVVSARLFLDIVREMPSSNVSFELKEGNTAYLSSGNSEFDIQGIVADEFPKIESGIEGEGFVLAKKMFRDMIRMTAFSASLEEARGIIKGVLCEIRKDYISLVALDGFRMAITREDIKGEDEKNIIISSRIINEIGKIITDTEEEEGDINIVAGDNKAEIIIGETKAVVRLMEGEFIKYKDIIPKESKISLKVDKKDISESVKRASIIVRDGKNSFIKFKLEGDNLIISSRADEGRNKDIINIDKVTGEDIEIGFNGRFINEVLRVIPDEKIIMEFSTSISPCIIKPVDGNKYEYLILPVRLSTGNI